VGKLDESRLVVIDREDHTGIRYVEPAHDALIRAWGKLWEWVKEFGGDTSLRNDLVTRIREYNRNGQPESLLFHKDKRLDQLEEIRNLDSGWMNEQEARFVSRSISVRRRNRIRLNSLLLLAVFILSGLLIYANQQRLLAEKNADEAKNQQYKAEENAREAELQKDTAEKNAKEATENLKKFQIAEAEKVRAQLSGIFNNAVDLRDYERVYYCMLKDAENILKEYSQNPFLDDQKEKLDSMAKYLKKGIKYTCE
jgi:hypothetical protein